MEERQAHNLKVPGSKPGEAKKKKLKIPPNGFLVFL